MNLLNPRKIPTVEYRPNFIVGVCYHPVVNIKDPWHNPYFAYIYGFIVIYTWENNRTKLVYAYGYN